MIDAPGPWGTGPFTLVEGYSSINTRIGIQRPEPFAATPIIEGEDRSPRLVLEANPDHWNPERRPRLERVVFRNSLTPAEALELCCTTEGEVDIVTELTPVDAAKVLDSEHARLVAFDANRVLAGIINRGAADVPLDDRRAREALNWAVDRHRLAREGLAGYATPLYGLTVPWASGHPAGAEPRAQDAARARTLMNEAGWPSGRALRIAAPGAFAGVAEMVAADVRESLGIEAEVIVVPPEEIPAGTRALIEKKLDLPWDILLHAWGDLSSEMPPAAVHREFFGSDGAFRAGPVDEGFDRLFDELRVELDTKRAVALAEQIDAYCHDESLALFLCAPQALYAVNRHVTFGAYRTTFELAETEVAEGHWSRRAPR